MPSTASWKHSVSDPVRFSSTPSSAGTTNARAASPAATTTGCLIDSNVPVATAKLTTATVIPV